MKKEQPNKNIYSKKFIAKLNKSIAEAKQGKVRRIDEKELWKLWQD